MQSEATNSRYDESPESARWYAAYTKHQHERKCADLLTRRGVEVYLPLYRCVRQWQDRRKKLALPLFPGYVFFRSTLSNRIEILSTPGVFFIVASAGRASSIPDQDIHSLRTMTNSQAIIEPHPFLHSGDLVRIRRGPLAGVRGILTRLKNQDRLVLCVELLRKAVSVEVNVWDVEKMPARNAPIGTAGIRPANPGWATDHRALA